MSDGKRDTKRELEKDREYSKKKIDASELYTKNFFKDYSLFVTMNFTRDPDIIKSTFKDGWDAGHAHAVLEKDESRDAYTKAIELLKDIRKSDEHDHMGAAFDKIDEFLKGAE